ncbi:MAG TPA: DNA polymerase IV [Acidimicrobiia bacterium]|nr:DNA polymerase IV [Acidimicrobiia bacterium]
MAPSGTELTILHLDLDAFYASVEQLADPSLRGRPVIVGGLGRRGVVAAASYEARGYGVHSAMPMGRARRACPDGVFLAPRFDAYGDASESVMAIVREVTPMVEPLALDEAFLDVSGARRLHGSAPEIAVTLRRRINDETGLVASVGVASTKFVAKLASDLAKPDGLLVVEAGGEIDFIHPLPVRRLWGVGPKTGQRLAQLGVRTIGDVAALPEETLVHALGDSHGRHLHALAWNRDDPPVEPGRVVKSVGHEETFPTDITDRETLAREALRMSERVAERLRDGRRAGRTVQLKLRYKNFRTITRSRTLPEPTNLAADIGGVARTLLDAAEIGDGIRLLGVAMQQLYELDDPDEGGEHDQLPLDIDHPDDAGAARGGDRRRRAVEDSMDAVRRRFGDDAVGSAALLDRGAHSEPKPGAGA